CGRNRSSRSKGSRRRSCVVPCSRAFATRSRIETLRELDLAEKVGVPHLRAETLASPAEFSARLAATAISRFRLSAAVCVRFRWFSALIGAISLGMTIAAAPAERFTGNAREITILLARSDLGRILPS